MAPVDRFRFYEELNDHLPPERRKVDFDAGFRPGDTVGDQIRILGVPARAVDLVLVNGEPSPLSRRLQDGDRVSVYPVFESFDISSVTKVRAAPLRELRFTADPRLGALVRYLRLLGFDCILRAAAGVETGSRILLTTEAGPSLPARALRVRGRTPRLQALDVLARLDLVSAAAALTRCLRCNALLAPALPAGELPTACPRCGRACPAPDRLRRMGIVAGRLLAQAKASAAGAAGGPE